jgi:hypothetical protein
VTIAQAQADLDAVSAALAAESPALAGWRVRLVPLRDALYGWTKPRLLTLEFAVAAMLLLTCANIAALLLARGAARQREVAMRLALGASRGRVVRQLLTESLVVGLLAGALGAIVARIGLIALDRCSSDRRPDCRGSARWASTHGSPAASRPRDRLVLMSRLAAGARESRGSTSDPRSVPRPSWRASHRAPRAGAARWSRRRSPPAEVLLVARSCSGSASSPERTRAELRAARPADLLVRPAGRRVRARHRRRRRGARVRDQPDRVADDSRGSTSASAPFPARTSSAASRIRRSTASSCRPPPSGRRRDRPLQLLTQTAAYFLVTPRVFRRDADAARLGREFADADTGSAPWGAVVNETLARLCWPGEESDRQARRARRRPPSAR